MHALYSSFSSRVQLSEIDNALMGRESLPDQPAPSSSSPEPCLADCHEPSLGLMSAIHVQFPYSNRPAWLDEVILLPRDDALRGRGKFFGGGVRDPLQDCRIQTVDSMHVIVALSGEIGIHVFDGYPISQRHETSEILIRILDQRMRLEVRVQCWVNSRDLASVLRAKSRSAVEEQL